MLYHAFDADNWFFEIIDMSHKLLLTGFVQLLPQEMQIPAVLVICTLYLMLLLLRSPYRNAGYENLHLLSQNLLLILFYSGLLARERVERGESMELMLGVLFIVLSISLLGLMMRQVTQGLHALLRQLKEFRASLSSNARPRSGKPTTLNHLGFRHRENRELVMSRNPLWLIDHLTGAKVDEFNADMPTNPTQIGTSLPNIPKTGAESQDQK
jgi:hypothetical protein